MPVVTMMWIGGQRSLMAAASFNPTIEPGGSMSVKYGANAAEPIYGWEILIEGATSLTMSAVYTEFSI
jgi:hypothetical protein